MDRSAKYRWHAADCFAAAQNITDPHLRAAMLSMARSWGALADHAEQRSNPWAAASKLEECLAHRPSAEPRRRLD